MTNGKLLSDELKSLTQKKKKCHVLIIASDLYRLLADRGPAGRAWRNQEFVSSATGRETHAEKDGPP